MPLLFSDKAPFVLTVLFGIFAWQAGQLFESVRSGNAIIYEVGTRAPEGAIATPNVIALRMENPSRTNVAGEFTFAILCMQAKSCLSGEVKAVVEAPVSAKVSVDGGQSREQAMIRATLGPGAVVWLVAEAATPHPEVEAIFDGNPSGTVNAEPVRVIAGDSFEAQIVGGWIAFLYGGMILVALAIGASLIGGVVSWQKSRKSAPPTPTLSGQLTLSDAVTHAALDELKQLLEEQMKSAAAKLDALSQGEPHVPKKG